MKKHCTAIVLAGGKGTRMGADVPKQYLPLAGRPLIWYSL
jgi:2-C-methyl-D-erythritol 4-phosphate cytidylyltransferase